MSQSRGGEEVISIRNVSRRRGWLYEVIYNSRVLHIYGYSHSCNEGGVLV